MTDIVEFLTARLDEREQLARGVEHAVGDQYDALTAAMGTTYGLSMVSLYWRSHDPARVLAEVKAKRAIVKAQQDFAARVDAASYKGYDALNYHRDRGTEAALMGTLRYLASIYADHPDYDPAWRVNAT